WAFSYCSWVCCVWNGSAAATGGWYSEWPVAGGQEKSPTTFQGDSMSTNQESAQVPGAGPARKPSKKDQILTLYAGGINEVEDLAIITNTRPNYVASVLEQAKVLPGYFDLYTTTAKPMNIYSKFFARKLGFKDEATARASVELIDRYYRQF